MPPNNCVVMGFDGGGRGLRRQSRSLLKKSNTELNRKHKAVCPITAPVTAAATVKGSTIACVVSNPRSYTTYTIYIPKTSLNVKKNLKQTLWN
ncbi:hypothetical protein ZOSMA_55G00090 [Zostera marina]|uniref:Uncharacterized protein n=1 Tax=Zostera marina TaxID=29655 RepID=A0A0K9NYD9_ZOSMR|nr:hypothetical protein ZOSMA_55G00090 [Zostera marina]